MKDSKTINKRQWHELEYAAKTLGVKESEVLAAIETVGSDRETVYEHIKSDTTQRTLATLPEPYRSQALANVDKKFHDYNPNMTDLEDALLIAFNWAKSQEGTHYWCKVHDAVCDLRYNYSPERLLEALKK